MIKLTRNKVYLPAGDEESEVKFLTETIKIQSSPLGSDQNENNERLKLKRPPCTFLTEGRESNSPEQEFTEVVLQPARSTESKTLVQPTKDSQIHIIR